MIRYDTTYVLKTATHPTAAAKVHTVWFVVVIVLIITDPLYIGHQHHVVWQLFDYLNYRLHHPTDVAPCQASGKLTIEILGCLYQIPIISLEPRQS